MNHQELQDVIATERFHGLAYVAHLVRQARLALGMDDHGRPLPPSEPIYRSLRIKRGAR
jgi:hypothetical protein